MDSTIMLSLLLSTSATKYTLVASVTFLVWDMLMTLDIEASTPSVTVAVLIDHMHYFRVERRHTPGVQSLAGQEVTWYLAIFPGWQYYHNIRII
ncbi:hypothetical protein HYPSUDRAFT_859647 [Hypholoma sublateritium FD-334 SS-4]|uniref:Uncharacterized protein n=1 Tax=Hypholoma sublateritium (strain FD-334 SS-4) TaxID=945553 RepID=A0A0D2NL51_HYPSF|nr:hypothetical protein HYPSUDRAFT_859647 [Hypholoma sublateritium FD-334 SS-4]